MLIVYDLGNSSLDVDSFLQESRVGVFSYKVLMHTSGGILIYLPGAEWDGRGEGRGREKGAGGVIEIEYL